MSWMKMATHMSSSVMISEFMRDMKKAGALMDPKDIAKYS